jgi:hypothetical protein
VVAELVDTETEGSEDQAGDEVLVTPSEEIREPLAVSVVDESAVSPLSEPLKSALSPPAWLTGPVTQR